MTEEELDKMEKTLSKGVMYIPVQHVRVLIQEVRKLNKQIAQLEHDYDCSMEALRYERERGV